MAVRTLLVAARARTGLSLRALARAAGVDPAALSRYERGGKVPRSDTVERLLAAMGLELDVRLARSPTARFVDLLCARQAAALLDDPTLVAAARRELTRLEGRSAWHDTWAHLLEAGPLACAGVLTSTSEAARPLKSDSPFAFVVDVPDSVRQELLEHAHAA